MEYRTIPEKCFWIRVQAVSPIGWEKLRFLPACMLGYPAVCQCHILPVINVRVLWGKPERKAERNGTMSLSPNLHDCTSLGLFVHSVSCTDFQTKNIEWWLLKMISELDPMYECTSGAFSQPRVHLLIFFLERQIWACSAPRLKAVLLCSTITWRMSWRAISLLCG